MAINSTCITVLSLTLLACLLAAGSSAAVADPHVRLVLDRQHAGLCARGSKQEAGERAIQNRDDSGSSTKLNFLPGRPPLVSDYKISASQGFMRRRHRDNLHQQFEAGLARVRVLDRQQSSLLTCLIYCSQGLSPDWKTTYKQPYWQRTPNKTNTSHPLTKRAVARLCTKIIL
jgi:hypothetical protein